MRSAQVSASVRSSTSQYVITTCVQNIIINKNIVKRPVHLISEVIVLMSLTLPWSRLKIKARGVRSYVNQSPYLATMAGPPLALKMLLKYLKKHNRNRYIVIVERQLCFAQLVNWRKYVQCHINVVHVMY